MSSCMSCSLLMVSVHEVVALIAENQEQGKANAELPDIYKVFSSSVFCSFDASRRRHTRNPTVVHQITHLQQDPGV